MSSSRKFCSFDWSSEKLIGNIQVDLRQSSFIRNNASEGAALIALNQMNFAYSTSSFKQNTGGDMASMPTSLRLKIYSFESYFLFVDDITAKDLLSNPSIVNKFFKIFSNFSRSWSMIQLPLICLKQSLSYLELIPVFYLRWLSSTLLAKRWARQTMRMLFKFFFV